jgi:hypothetical protein
MVENKYLGGSEDYKLRKYGYSVMLDLIRDVVTSIFRVMLAGVGIGYFLVLAFPDCFGVFLMGRKHCEVCECRKSELVEQRLVESWLCLFFDDVFCLYPKIPREKRVGSVCLSCSNYAKFMRVMDEEDARFDDEVDEANRLHGVVCVCDGKLCDNEVLGGCFSVEGSGGMPTDVLLSVCSRFDVNRVSGMIKDEFLRLRKRGGGSI